MKKTGLPAGWQSCFSSGEHKKAHKNSAWKDAVRVLFYCFFFSKKEMVSASPSDKSQAGAQPRSRRAF